MTAVVDRPAAGHGLRPSPVAQSLSLVRRSLMGYVRRPGLTMFPLVFPLFFALLSSAQFDKATALPGFPKVNGFVDFVLAATITQGVMFGAVQAGSDMATDVQGGFFDRLLASPLSRTAVLVGSLGGAGVYAACQATIFTVLLVLFGATVKGGVIGALVLILYGALVGVAIAGFLVGMAIRSGSTEVVQSSFPLVFIVLFLSSAFFPATLMSGWYKAVASHSPVTWMIDGARDLVIGGLHARSVWRALGVPAVFAAASCTFAAFSLRKRLAAR